MMARALLLSALLLAAGCLGAADDGVPDGPEPTGANGSTDEAPDDDAPPGDDPPPDNGSEPDDDEDPEAPSRPRPRPEVVYPPWPSLDEATIRPGVRVADGSCTSNFLFRSPDNSTLYLGTAAHCVSENDGGSVTSESGCAGSNKPFSVGQTVQIDGASEPGILAYTSWGTMQAAGENDGDACDHNDFALIQISGEDRFKAHPAMLHFGGPTELGSMPGMGDHVLSYGHSSMRPGVEELNWHEGYVVDSRAWTFNMVTVAPGIPGDSGSAVITGDGHALGLLVSVEIIPLPATNGVTALAPALEYANAHGMPVELVGWELLDQGLLP